MNESFNPLTKTIRLKAPEDMGDTFSVAGFEVRLEKDRTVEVPPQFVEQLKAHGFVEAKTSAAPKK